MNADLAIDSQIQSEIERLRAQFPETQDLYREACVLLFFRFGITPTANKLYQYVRKGSMSAPAQALSRFWSDLREKSRVRIEHPDLPDDLRASAGELLNTLWRKAQSDAQASLEAQGVEYQELAEQALQAQAMAEEGRDAAERATASVQQKLDAANAKLRLLERQLAAEAATRAALEKQVQQGSQDLAAQQRAQEEARQSFSSELEKLRAANQLAEERFQASEKRALLEIDRERIATLKLRKELDAVRNEAREGAERHKAALLAAQAETGQLQQTHGILEGSLQTVSQERERLTYELQALRAELTEALSKAAGLRAENEAWRERTLEARQMVANLEAKSSRQLKKRLPRIVRTKGR